MRVEPVTRTEARTYVARYHRHHARSLPQWLFGVKVLDDEGTLVGVAYAARPARLLQDGRTLTIARVCTDGTRDACSFAIGALRRAAVALGYTRIYTYTHLDEPGSSMRAAGFVDDGVTKGGEWGREGRPRETENTEKKRRWVWPADARR